MSSWYILGKATSAVSQANKCLIVKTFSPVGLSWHIKYLRNGILTLFTFPSVSQYSTSVLKIFQFSSSAPGSKTIAEQVFNFFIIAMTSLPSAYVKDKLIGRAPAMAAPYTAYNHSGQFLIDTATHSALFTPNFTKHLATCIVRSYQSLNVTVSREPSGLTNTNASLLGLSLKW